MNRIIVIVEAEHNDEQGRIEISRTFPGDITRDQVLDLFADALRGAGYRCGTEALRVEDEPTIPAGNSQPTCWWVKDVCAIEGDTWLSICGRRWILASGGPAENKIRYCHGCGKPVHL